MNFKNLSNSIYNPEFYKNLKNQPTKASLRYYFSFVTYISILSAIFISVFILPKLWFLTSKDTVINAINQFPADLEVAVKNGIATSNAKEPYVVNLDQEFQKIFGKDLKNADTISKNGPGVLIIDTKDTYSLDSFKEYPNFTLLTKDSLVSKNESQGKTTINNLKGVPDLTINKTTLLSWESSLRPYVWIITPMFILGAFLVNMFIYCLYLLILFVTALLILLMAKLMKVEANYAYSYRISLHAVTLSIIFEAILMVFGFPIPRFVPTLILIIVVYFNLNGIRKIPVAEATLTPSEKL
jgi:hypothetical protein